MDEASKDDLRWRIERIAITTVRRPAQYILGASAVLAAVLNTLEVMTPVKEWIAGLPLVGDSESLFYLLVVAVVAVLLHTLSRALSAIVGVQPFESLAEYVGDQIRIPALTGSIDRELRTRSGEHDVPLEYRVRPISSGEVEAFNQLNRDLFRYTSFALPLRAIRRRNSGMYAVDPLALAFVEAIVAGKYVPVGISHIVPLNDVGTALYIRDHGLRDGELTRNHMARRGVWSDAIVLFSMGLTKAVRGRLVGDGNIILDVYVQHLLLILDEMVKANPGKTETSIYSQTERPRGSIGTLLSGLHFHDTGMVSGDGFSLWQAQLRLSGGSERSKLVWVLC